MNYKEQYIAKMWEAIKETDIKGSFPSVIIAQGALESDWGRSSLAADYNNYFGIKAGSSWTGATVNKQTWEVFAAGTMNIAANFRVYSSVEASLKDRIAVLEKSYPSALAASAPMDEIQALKNGGYATATNYVSTVYSIIETNNLTEYDIKFQNTMKATTTYSIFLVLGIFVAGLSVYKLLNK